MCPPGSEKAEAAAWGAETARAMREALGVAVTSAAVEQRGETTKVMRELEEVEEPATEVELPDEAVENPIRYAMQVALEEVAQAYMEDNEARANSRKVGPRLSPTERARTRLAAYSPEMPDGAAMVDSRGRSLVEKGWIPRWVRDKDEAGRPDSRRVRRFLAMGCKDVLDEDGRPLVGRFGRAMQMPPRLYASFILQQSPSGAFDSCPHVQNALELGEEMNRAMGRKIVDVRPASGHGSRRGGEW